MRYPDDTSPAGTALCKGVSAYQVSISLKIRENSFCVVRSLLADVISHLTEITSHFADVTSHFADESRLMAMNNWQSIWRI